MMRMRREDEDEPPAQQHEPLLESHARNQQGLDTPVEPKPYDTDSAYASYASPVTPTTPHPLPQLTHPAANQILPSTAPPPKDPGPPAWSSLPRKDQLAILTIARLAEPIVQTSISSYMFFMLKSFDPTLSDASISWQAGLLTASFTAAQAVTAMLWGRLADSASWGRKSVLLIGLSGTLLATVGFGFSRNFYTALFFRTLGGGLNGNVGVMRTMISETIQEKKFQPKAFLLMPLTFNIGVLIGPVLGGYLSDPVKQWPVIFGGEGWNWLRLYPYALPNLVTSLFLVGAMAITVLGLEETHPVRKAKRDMSLEAGRKIGRFLVRISGLGRKGRDRAGYMHVPQDSVTSIDLETSNSPPQPQAQQSEPSGTHLNDKPTKIFTKNVIATLITHGFFALHVGTFNTLWFIFLSTPRAPPSPQLDSSAGRGPLSGGLSFSPQSLGLAIATIGLIGITLQFGIYAAVTHRLGVLRTFTYSALLFPLVYSLAPFLTYIPGPASTGDENATPEASGRQTPQMWIAIVGILSLQVLGRTFALPGTQIMVNNCAPSPSVLGTIHGAGMSVSAATRTLGPLVFSAIYGAGLERGNVGVAWWVLSIEALVVVVTVRWVKDIGV